MTTDNRTNEPTEAQVEAAAKALEEHRHVMVAPGPHRCSCGYVLDGWAAAHKLHSARAALVAAAGAAQGAAPQAERDWRLDVVPEPWVTAPVSPSSGVDEDARRLSAWPTVDEVRAQFEKAADRIAFGRMIAEVERAAAEKAWDRCVGEMPIDQDWKIFYGDNNPYRGA